jgi:hypothetical protein
MSLFNKQNICPIPEEKRVWLENALIWLINQFGLNKLLDKKTLLPEKEYFPINFDGLQHIANEILPILCEQMEIKINDIQINFYKEGGIESKNDFGQSIFTQQYQNKNYSAGLYFGKNEEGKFLIGLEESLLDKPSKLIATMAHELSHVKIMGENRLQNPDEKLIDLVTVFFGIGIFNANSAAIFYKNLNAWGYSKQGYLSQQEWGYSLALYSYIRHEVKPPWIMHLTPNIKSDFLKSKKFIEVNTDKVLVY